MPADYQSTARALALPIDSPPTSTTTSPTRTRAVSPSWSRRPHSSSFRRSTHSRHGSTTSQRPTTFMGRLKAQSRASYTQYSRLPVQYQVAMSLFGIVVIIFAVLFLVYQERIWAALVPRAEAWRERRGGWLLLWFATVVVGFPPLIGYGTCVTLAGFVYGVSRGWLIAATATTIGSTLSFLASRHLFSPYVSRLLSTSSHATTLHALSSTLQHDGLTLLIALRLCPLPYSLSNGAIATTFPPETVNWAQFVAATAAATPKLLIHVFIGSRVAAIARSGGEMDFKTRMVNYGGILLGMVIGVGTGVVIYRRTKRRAAELELQLQQQQGRAGARGGAVPVAPGRRFADEPDDADVERAAGAGADDISLREREEFEEEEEEGYRDYLTDEEDEGEHVDSPFAGVGSGVGVNGGSRNGEKPK